MNCYEKIGLSRVVNASGRMSKLGASTISDITATQVIEAEKNYVVVDELIDRAGQIISKIYIGSRQLCLQQCIGSNSHFRCWIDIKRKKIYY